MRHLKYVITSFIWLADDWLRLDKKSKLNDTKWHNWWYTYLFLKTL